MALASFLPLIGGSEKPWEKVLGDARRQADFGVLSRSFTAAVYKISGRKKRQFKVRSKGWGGVGIKHKYSLEHRVFQ